MRLISILWDYIYTFCFFSLLWCANSAHSSDVFTYMCMSAYTVFVYIHRYFWQPKNNEQSPQPNRPQTMQSSKAQHKHQALKIHHNCCWWCGKQRLRSLWIRQFALTRTVYIDKHTRQIETLVVEKCKHIRLPTYMCIVRWMFILWSERLSANNFKIFVIVT